MTAADFATLLPLILLAATSLLVLLALAVGRRRGYAPAFVISLVGTAAAFLSIGVSWMEAPRRITALLSIDRFSLFAMALIDAATLIVAIISFAYVKDREKRGEYYFLLLLASLGGSILSASAHFASFFLGLELLSVPLFTLIAFERERLRGVEAGFTYLILSGVSSAFLLFGMALCYQATGSLEIAPTARAIVDGSGGFLVLAGIALMTVGIGFKLAIVPFHFWTPDIYDGAPAPVAGYIATVSKGAMAVLLVRFLASEAAGGIGVFSWVFAVISGVTMFAGNLLALREDNVKRILAYSSIAHLGYLLVAFVAGGTRAVTAVSLFLAAYFASTLGAFASITALSSRERDADRIEDYRGLAGKRPLIAGCFTASLLSLAGLPLTAGFMGKFVLFAAGESSALWVLAILLAVNSTISLFYYLKVVSAMYVTLPASEVSAATGRASGRAAMPFFTGLALALSSLAIVAIGVYPTPLLRLIELFTP